MKRIIIAVASLVLAVSCKTPQKVEGAGKPKVPVLKKQNTNALVAKIKANQIKYKWITAHFSIDIDKDSSNISFSGDLRMKKDSVIWMSVRAVLGTIEAARIMVTEDSAMMMDRINDNYFKGDYNYINSRLNSGEDVDFDLMRSVMTGSTMEFYSDTAKMNSYFDGKQYIISTIRRMGLRRAVYRNKPYHSKEDAQFIFVDPQDFHIARVRLEDFVNHRTFDAYYTDFQKVDSVMFPFHIQYQFVGQKKIKIDLQYKKVSFREQETVPFIIPKKYTRVQY